MADIATGIILAILLLLIVGQDGDGGTPKPAH